MIEFLQSHTPWVNLICFCTAGLLALIYTPTTKALFLYITMRLILAIAMLGCACEIARLLS
jgi:hypothetical protein